jgi:hypothetical protein
MARRIGQIVGRGRPTSWLVRVCSGRDREAMKREYLNQTISGRTAGRSNSSQPMACMRIGIVLLSRARLTARTQIVIDFVATECKSAISSKSDQANQ